MRAPWTIVLCAAPFLAARPLAAQAICSAPHSGPILAASGSISTLPRGSGWVQRPWEQAAEVSGAGGISLAYLLSWSGT